MKTTSMFKGGLVAVVFSLAGTLYSAAPAEALTSAGVVNLNTSAAAGSQASSSAGLNVNAAVTTTGTGTAAVSVSSSGSTGSSGDLTAYVNSLAGADASVSAVNTSSNNTVSIEYKRPAKLFGFINMNLTETATVTANADGSTSTSVHKSWWSFLASSKTNSDQFSSMLKSRVQSDTSASGSASVNGQLTAYQKGQYLGDIAAAEQATY